MKLSLKINVTKQAHVGSLKGGEGLINKCPMDTLHLQEIKKFLAYLWVPFSCPSLIGSFCNTPATEAYSNSGLNRAYYWGYPPALAETEELSGTLPLGYLKF